LVEGFDCGIEESVIGNQSTVIGKNFEEIFDDR
jgi:hypothetical protein